MMGGRCVVKAQIYAGGRGKAGGVQMVYHPEQAHELAKELFGKRLVTAQTGPGGAQGAPHPGGRAGGDRVASSTSPSPWTAPTSRYCVIASAEGGVEIEEVAAKSPEKIHKPDHRPLHGAAPLPGPQASPSLSGSRNPCEDCVQLDPQPLSRAASKKTAPWWRSTPWWSPRPAGCWPWTPKSPSTTTPFSATGNTTT